MKLCEIQYLDADGQRLDSKIGSAFMGQIITFWNKGRFDVCRIISVDANSNPNGRPIANAKLYKSLYGRIA